MFLALDTPIFAGTSQEDAGSAQETKNLQQAFLARSVFLENTGLSDGRPTRVVSKITHNNYPSRNARTRMQAAANISEG